MILFILQYTVIHFLLFIAFEADGQFQFEVETVDYFFLRKSISFNARQILERKKTQQMIDNHRFNSLDLAEKWDLCLGAQKYAVLDGMLADSEERELMKVNEIFLMHLNGSIERRIGLICPSIPVVALCLADENSDKLVKMKIILEKNDFMDESYHVEVVESIKSVSINAENIAWTKDYTEEVQWEICFAARTRVARKITITSESVSETGFGVFNVKYQNGRTEKGVVMFPCPSYPEIYVRVLPSEFIIMFVEPGTEVHPPKLPSRL